LSNSGQSLDTLKKVSDKAGISRGSVGKVDYLERRMVNEGFRIENVKVTRRYTISELQQRLNYK